MNRFSSTTLKLIPACLCIGLCLLANNAKAYYFDVNGAAAGYGVVNGGSYSWDAANWAPSSGGGVATVNWVPGDFARFYGGVSGDSYAVTLNADESVAGMWNHTAGVTLTLNAAGAGVFDLQGLGLQGFLGASGASTYIYAPIVGDGGVAPETTGHTMYLYGNNTYSGGTTFGFSGSPLVYFNNNNSFGTGPITSTFSGGGYQGVLATGGAAITLANNWIISGNGGGINFASNPNTPVTSSGTWTLAGNTLLLRNSGGSTSPLTISGAISGTSSLILSANGSSSITLSGPNSFSGTITVTGAGGTYGGSAPVTLKLGAANTIASITGLVLAGGTLDPGGFNQAMSSATLSLTANSTIDFGAGASELDFADSSSLSWSGNLNLVNWDPMLDALRFGTDENGLTPAQLGMIGFDGAGFGTAYLDTMGYVVVPEPSTVVLGLLGGLGLLWASRRRKA